MEINEAVAGLAALAQESRLSIFRLLVEVGPKGLSVGRIGKKLKIPGATLSFHLKELARAGLVSSRQEKQFFYYSIDFPRMAALMTFLTQNCCKGMPEECVSGVENALSRCCAPQASRTGKIKARRSCV